MVCIDEVMVCDIGSFSSSIQQLGLKVMLTNSVNSNPLDTENCFTNLCLESTGSSLLTALTPIIVKLAFMIMLWLILHLFYSSIPGEI